MAHPISTAHRNSFATLKAGYNQIVHAISKAGVKALTDAGHSEPPAPHHGPWLHRHMVASTTASIELTTIARTDITFIAQHSILTRACVELRCPLSVIDPNTDRETQKDLIPDALFGLQYHTSAGDKFRFFVVEADRGTEPATSANWNRKSFVRHLLQYQAYIAQGRYKDHLKLTAPLLVLNVVPDAKRLDLMLRQTERQLGTCAYQLFQPFLDLQPLENRPP